MASTPRSNGQHHSAKISRNRSPGRAAGLTRRIAATLALACLATGLGGCGSGQTISDYLNLRNSFLNPAEVGRFDKANPWGSVKPVKWPILEQLDVIDSPATEWDSATDPTPADIVAEKKEFTIGAGDMVRISIYDLAQPGQEYLKETTVSEIGTVDLLYIGQVRIGGLTPSEADEKIGQEAVDKRALVPAGNGAPGPQVSVTILQSRDRIFSILGLGTVSRPGTYNIIGSNFRVLDALALAGDIQVQPGLDYIYVIREGKSEMPVPVTPSGASGTPGTSNSTPTPPPAGNPLDALNGVENATTTPSSAPASPPAEPSSTPAAPPPAPSSGPAETAPAPMSPGAAGPAYVGPIPTAVVMSNGKPGMRTVSQADLDAALTEPAATGPATGAATGAAVGPASAPAAMAPGKSGEMLDQALDSSAPKGQSVFVDGKWVTLPAKATGATLPATVLPTTMGAMPTPLPGPSTPAVMPAGGPASGGEALAAAREMSGHRVIRIPIAALRSGDPRYNIVIKPGDTIIVPPVETGEFYVMGHVTRPGVFSLTGRKITLKMAIAAAGNLDALAIPRRCDLVRRIGTNQEAIVQVNLQAIFDGTQPDIFLKPNDLINVGTDAVSPFLAVTRNAYRLSYGLGFVYDRNYYIQPTVP